MRRNFMKGDIVHIDGDIEFDDYNVRVDTMAVVVDVEDLLRCNPQYRD